MKIKHLFFILILAGVGLSCNAQTSQNNEQTNEDKVQADQVDVYYFHMTRRCATCKTVENVAREAVNELNKENVTFHELNIENSEGKEMAKELNVSGQALLIVGGDKKINITRKGFMHARTNPDKLKEIVEEKINAL